MATRTLLSISFLLGFIAMSCLGDRGNSRSEKETVGCGRVNSFGRIIGGNEVDIYEYPWMVELVIYRPFRRGLCGGSIIHEKFVLTAAHCFNEDVLSVEVVIGEHHRKKSNDPDVWESIKVYKDKIFIHEDYKTAIKGNDIALLRLSKPVDFRNKNNKVAPICPPEPDNLYSEVDSTITGWGQTEPGLDKPSSNILLEVTVKSMSNSDCQDAYVKYKREITDDMICAGVPEGGKDACQGDSGGPMITYDSGIYRQIGVVSWGQGCGLPGVPGVYARVTDFLDWIQEKMGEYRWRSPDDLSRQAPPSTDDFKCPSTGIFPDPSDITKYFNCMEGVSANTYKAFSSDCPDGLEFNPSSKTCDWHKEESSHERDEL